MSTGKASSLDLDEILEQIKNIDISEKPEEEFDEYLNPSFIQSLISKAKNNQTDNVFITHVFQVLAELAKTDNGRQQCTNEDIVVFVAQYVLNYNLKHFSHSVSYQACRLIGNICFESETARDICLLKNVHFILCKLVSSLAEEQKSSSSPNPSLLFFPPPTPFATNIYLHLKVNLSAIINMIDDHDRLQTHLLECNILSNLLEILTFFPNFEDLIKIVLSILDYYQDLNNETVLTFVNKHEFWEALFVLLRNSKDQELIDSIFQLMASYAENDVVKETVASSGFIHKLLVLIEAGEEDGMVKLSDLSSDFIILILTGDKSMELLFNSGNGDVYKRILKWLKFTQPLKLQTAAAFSLCNFARADLNCKRMIEEDIHRDIQQLLQQHPADEQVPVLQHALLGTLCNLAISPNHKQTLVLSGVVDTCLSFLGSSSFTVLFKLLATIRMLLDKHVSEHLINNEVFVSKLLESCDFDQHQGIKFESLRIYAWLIKYLTPPLVMLFKNYEPIKRLLVLLNQSYPILQNEALLALILLCTNNVLDDDMFKNYSNEIYSQLNNILKIESSSSSSSSNATSSSSASSSSSSSPPSSPPVEVLCNAINLVAVTKQFKTMEEIYKEKKFCEGIKEKWESSKDPKFIYALKNLP